MLKMNNQKLFTYIILAFFVVSSFGQNNVENWETYIAFYDDEKPGSTTVRMDLINEAPKEGFDYVLVAGLKYESIREDGFPENNTLQTLYKAGDELIELLNATTENIQVGSFMFDYERLEYFYIKSNNGIENKLRDFFNTNYPNNEYYINLEEDKNWSYYREFLYPSDEILEYLGDLKVVQALQEAGDNLTKARRVDHWAYFNERAKMNSFIAEVKEQGFTVQNSGKIDQSTNPYQVQFHRIDNVDLDSIYTITSSLRRLAITYDGDYDGWETSVEKD